jgi:hypothetical protein
LSPSSRRRTLPSGAGTAPRAARSCSAKDGRARSEEDVEGGAFSFSFSVSVSASAPRRFRFRSSLARFFFPRRRLFAPPPPARAAPSPARARVLPASRWRRGRLGTEPRPRGARSRRRRGAGGAPRGRAPRRRRRRDRGGGRRSPEAGLPVCVASATRICKPSQYGKRRPARSAGS